MSSGGVDGVVSCINHVAPSPAGDIRTFNCISKVQMRRWLRAACECRRKTALISARIGM